MIAGPSLLCCLFLLLGGVFGADEIKVSVMEGDSVTLLINATDIQGAEDLWWSFKKERIARFVIKPVSQEIYDEGSFKDRLQVDHQTGSLTITNIRTSDAGPYEAEIRSTKTKFKSFSVIVSERKTEKTVSVMEGNSTIFDTDVKIQTDDKILWKFKGIIIARLTGPVNEGYKLNPQTGDLTITNIRRDQSGDYEMEIKRSSFILHRTFSVNVEESSQGSHSMNPGWWGLIVPIILIVPAGIYFIYRKIKKGNGVL